MGDMADWVNDDSPEDDSGMEGKEVYCKEYYFALEDGYSEEEALLIAEEARVNWESSQVDDAYEMLRERLDG